MKAAQIIVVMCLAVVLAGCVNVTVPKPPSKFEFNVGGGKDDNERDPTDDQIPSGARGSGIGGLIRHVAGATTDYMLAAEHGAVFHTYDVLAYPGSKAHLAARLRYSRNLNPISDVKITFYHGRRIIGSDETGSDGVASVKWKVGRVGTYHVSARITEVDRDNQALLRVSPSPLLVSVRNKDTPFLVVDLDRTVVGSSFLSVLTGDARAMSDSVSVLNRLARTDAIIYLTHRPALMTRRSKQWLQTNGFPPGPVLLSSFRGFFLGSKKYKSARLADLRKAYPNVRVGIGDKPGDAQAYVDSNMIAYLIPHYKHNAKDMRKAAKRIGELRGRGRLHVVDGWRQVERSLTHGHRFPPDPFCVRLHQRANRLEADQRRRKRDDDDDDDDDD